MPASLTSPVRRFTLAPGDTAARTWPLKPAAGWYDLAVETDGDDLRRIAGRIETARASLSDPAIGGPALTGVQCGAQGTSMIRWPLALVEML